MNIVGRSGGNTFRGSLFASGTGDALQSDNLTPALIDQGVTAATPLTGVYDVAAALGGPIARDRVWYFANAHAGASTRASGNVFYNLNAGASSQWLYSPDLNRREYSDRTFENASARLTWQIGAATQGQRLLGCTALCRTCTGATPGLSEPQRISPEAVGVLGRPLRVAQAAWSSPLTDRLLVDAAFGATSFGVGNFEREPNPTRALIRVAEQCTSGCAANGNIPGLVYRSQDFSVAHTGSYLWKGALTYVTGAHSLKVGYQQTFMTDDRTWMTNDQNLTYRFNNGVPNQLTQSISPWVNNMRVAWQGAVRSGSVDAQSADAAGRGTIRSGMELVSSAAGRAVTIPSDADRHSRNARRRQLQGRDAADGRGVRPDRVAARRALKMTLGKYLEGAGASGNVRQLEPHAPAAADDAAIRHCRRDSRLDRRESQLRTRLRPARTPRRRTSAPRAAIRAACSRTPVSVRTS